MKSQRKTKAIRINPDGNTSNNSSQDISLNHKSQPAGGTKENLEDLVEDHQ